MNLKKEQLEGTEAWGGHCLYFKKVMLLCLRANVKWLLQDYEGMEEFVDYIYLGSDCCNWPVRKLIYGVLSLTVKEERCVVFGLSQAETPPYILSVFQK